LRDALTTIYTTQETPNKETASPDVIVNKNPRDIQWYNLGARVETLAWDTKVGDFSYKITYVIQPYKTPSTYTPYGKTNSYYGPHKRYNYWFNNIKDVRWNNYNRTEFEVSRDALTWKNEEVMNWINSGMPLNNIVSGIQLIGYTDRDRDVSLSLPEQIINLPNLTFIGIENSGLTTLPNSIGQLTHLRILDITDSNLNILPESIGQLTNLLSLKLINTKLTTLPQSIGQLSSLFKSELLHSQRKRANTSLRNGSIVYFKLFKLESKKISKLAIIINP
jgi:hypothetical protein